MSARTSGDNDKAPVVVAIGASAGGEQALQSFFSGIRPGTGAAFIIVVHLDPQRRHISTGAQKVSRTKLTFKCDVVNFQTSRGQAFPKA